MKPQPLVLLTAGLMALAATNSSADSVGGSPKADFQNDTLSVPCVLISNLDEATEGKYFDIVMDRRGNSYNYEVTFAEAEDTALCERIAEIARFEDDDYSEDDGDESDPAALTLCEVRTDRSSVTVEGRGLEDGNYYAVVTSGANTIESSVRPSNSEEVEFDFDSDSSEVAEGATAIMADFIVANAVNAEIFLEGSTTPVLSDAAVCMVK